MTTLVGDIAKRLGAWKAANGGALVPELRRGDHIRSLQAPLAIEQNMLCGACVARLLVSINSETLTAP